MSDKLTASEVSVLAEAKGISLRELENSLFWLNINADDCERMEGFRGGPDVIRRLLKPMRTE